MVWRGVTMAALVALAAGPALAAGETFAGSDEATYRLRALEGFVALQPEDKGLTLFLGEGCEAFSREGGFGTWGQANGGFVVALAGREVGFARQELPMPEGTDCPLE